MDSKAVESKVRDRHGFFTGWRVCHHDPAGVCCRGFWNRHGDDFQAGQVAQRLGLVRFVGEELYILD